LILSRKSELLLARWKDVDLGAGEWLVPAENARTAKPPIVYLSIQIAGMFYIVAEYGEQRKKMLQWRGDYVDSVVTESKVIAGNFGGVG
jgi:integrase